MVISPSVWQFAVCTVGRRSVDRMHPFNTLCAPATNVILFIGWTRSHEACDNKVDARLYQVRDSPSLPYSLYAAPLPRDYLAFRR